MNKFALKTMKGIAVLASSLVLCGSASAATVYDNSTTSLNQFFFTNGVEYGDQVFLASIERIITQVQFQYFATNLTGGESALFRLYSNATSNSGPGALLFDSGSFGLANGHQTVTVDGITGVQLSNNSLTWAVTFSGLTGNKQAGLELYDPPTVGSSFKDFWINGSSGWETFGYPGLSPAGNFAARVIAVPEAGTLVLGLFGSLLFAGYRLQRRAGKN